MYIICSDLEGIFVPEIWINVAERTGIKELRLTTRDISDYAVLMRRRLAILDKNNLKLKDIQNVIASMNPLEGALEFINWVRSFTQIIVVSDTFVQFARPLMRKLGWPTLFCHSLSLNTDGSIKTYNLRQTDGKKQTVLALQNLCYQIIGIGDSYNDMSMLKAADSGILFRPPQNVVDEFPEFPVTRDYEALKAIIQSKIEKG